MTMGTNLPCKHSKNSATSQSVVRAMHEAQALGFRRVRSGGQIMELGLMFVEGQRARCRDLRN